MAQMKKLIEQNQDQARQILIQNPKALFQAQIMLGMLQPPEEIPNIQPTASQQAAPPAQQSNSQPAPIPTQSNQTNPPLPSSSALPAHPLQQPTQHNRSHMNAQSAPVPAQQSTPSLPSHYPTQPPSVIQPTMPAVTTPLQQPLHMPLQPPLPRPPSMGPTFPHQNYSHVGPTPTAGFQHPGGPQMHLSQPMFNSGSRPPSSMGPLFSQQPPYQGGISHVGMDYNQMERGSSNWMPPPALSENAAPPFLPPRPASSVNLNLNLNLFIIKDEIKMQLISGDMETALLQQV